MAATDDNDTPPYRVSQRDHVHQVLDPSDRVIMECRDEASARHYAELMCRAYRMGFKAGYRHAKI